MARLMSSSSNKESGADRRGTGPGPAAAPSRACPAQRRMEKGRVVSRRAHVGGPITVLPPCSGAAELFLGDLQPSGSDLLRSQPAARKMVS